MAGLPHPSHTHLLGIDFGTSNTAAALVGADGKLHTLALDEGSTSMPTALFFSSEDGSVAYGRAAMRAYLEGHEGRLMRSIKSLLGSSLMNEQTLLNGRMVSYFEVVTLFFKELKRRCEHELGHPVHAVLLGRPAIYGLAHAGAAGVAHVLRLLRDELEIAMALTGCRTLAQATPALLQTPSKTQP